MYARLQRAACRMNWKGWSVAVMTASSALITQSTAALCDNNNINDNHLTPYLSKEIGKDEMRIQNSESKSDIHLKTFTKPENSLIEWGMHSLSKSPKQNSFFENIQIKTIQFSANVTIALDIDGNLYLKLKNDEWTQIKGLKDMADIAVTNDSIYCLTQSGKLLSFEYTKLENKFLDPCIEKQKRVKPKKMENCVDHRRKKSFSSMPKDTDTNANQNLDTFKSSLEFSDFLSKAYANKAFEANTDLSNAVIVRVYANNYRTFALSDTGTVYVKGDNQRRACGVGTDLFIHKFTAMNAQYFDSAITDISMGEDHTLFLSKLGRIFVCGSDNLMQLGLGWTKRKCILSDSNWTNIGRKGFEGTAKAFDRMSDAHSEESESYFFEVPSFDEALPRVVTGPFFDDYKVVAIASGDYHNACIVEPLYALHNPLKRRNRSIDSLLSDGNGLSDLSKELRQNRRVITWGYGMYGQLGHCNFTNASEPKPVKLLEKYREFDSELNAVVRISPIAIQCGKQHTIVLMESESDSCENKMVFAFGNNRYNQVSKKKKPKQASPYWIQSILPQRVSVSNIAAGNFQSAAYGTHSNPNQTFQFS